MSPSAAFVPRSRLEGKVSRFVLAATLLLALSCSEVPTTSEPAMEPSDAGNNGLASPGVGRSRIGARDVTIDFTSFGAGIAGGNVFEPDFYRSDGIRFPPQRCGSAGCASWLIWHIVQGDDALWGETRFGPIKATFTRPVSSLSLRVAPSLQGTATYVLSAFAASGKLLATTSVTVTQDFGDPANTGFGYFTVSLTNLPKPAKSFTLNQVFVRSSFPLNTDITYGVSSISYTHWGQQP